MNSKVLIASSPFFPTNIRINRSQMSKVVYKAGWWHCQDFYIGKKIQRLHDRKTEHFEGITSTCHACAISDHVTPNDHSLKWDHFEILDILAKGWSDTHFKIKETLLIQEIKPTLNDNVISEKKLSILVWIFYLPNFSQLLSLLFPGGRGVLPYMGYIAVRVWV